MAANVLTMRASALGLLAALSVAVPAMGAPSRTDQTATLTFKVVNMNGERRVLSRHGIDPYTYSLSPDHRELAYIAQPRVGEPDGAVMVADVRSPRERVLADTGCPFLGVSWAPNGRQLALDTSTGAYCYRAGLWFVNPDGSGFRQVTKRGAPLVWSPNSRFLAGSRPVNVLSLETGEVSFVGEGHSPAWSPDGRQIAYVRNSIIGVSDAPIGDAAGVPQRTHQSWTRGDYPSWSPDGSRIAFIRFFRNAYNLHLWVMPSRGGPPRRIARGLARFSPFLWSPKGRRIALVKGQGVYTKGLDSKPARHLAQETGEVRLLAWSRDGRRILYFVLKRPSD